jgi:hypothetical protein
VGLEINETWYLVPLSKQLDMDSKLVFAFKIHIDRLIIEVEN